MQINIQKFYSIIKSKSFIRNLKRCGAVLLTCLIIFGGYKCAYKILSDKVSYRHYNPFFKNKTDYDVFFMGSSHMFCSVFPMQLWNDYGITSYNLGMNSAFIHINYGLVQLFTKYKKPKIIFLDVVCAFNEYNITSNSFAHQAFDIFPMSIHKILILNDVFKNSKKEINIKELITPFSLYHSKWSDSKTQITELFDNSANKQMGAVYLTKMASSKFVPISKNMHYDVTAKELRFLKKFTDYCDKHKIKLVLCFIPFAANKQHQMTANTVALFAQKYNIPYINFLDEKVVDYSIDLLDKGNDSQHLNPSGARKVTDYIGKYLKEHYDLKDYRTNKKYAKKWNAYYADYKEYLKENIKKQTDFKILLMLLNNSNFKAKLQYSDRIKFDNIENTLLNQITSTCKTSKASYNKNRQS